MGSPSGFRLPPHSLRLHFWRRRLLWRSAWSRCYRCRPSWSCSPANVGHHFCDLKEPSSSGLVQARKIGYLPLTFFSTSLLAFGPYWVPFQSLFSLWYFAGGGVREAGGPCLTCPCTDGRRTRAFCPQIPSPFTQTPTTPLPPPLQNMNLHWPTLCPISLHKQQFHWPRDSNWSNHLNENCNQRIRSNQTVCNTG